MPITYAHAGVDIDAGDALVERIKPLARMTRIAEVLEDVGGFASLVAVPDGLDRPVLVSGTDGVGTKLKVAFATGTHDTIGQDLVAMCVNDVITTGARPLFFLDYFATAHLDVGVAEAVVRGIANACKACGCALVGGETAELPGMYAAGEYDLAGFAVGVVSRSKIVTGARVEVGDVAFGLPSSGLHSNGYSLARRALERLSYADRPAELGGQSVGEALLTPTRLYARTVAALLASPDVDVRAMAHVTGGGISGNVPRVLPEAMGLEITAQWTRSGIFDLVERTGPVEPSEMRSTFNLGIGFVIVVSASTANAAEAALGGRLRVGQDAGARPIRLGEIVAIAPGTKFEHRVIW